MQEALTLWDNFSNRALKAIYCENAKKHPTSDSVSIFIRNNIILLYERIGFKIHFVSEMIRLDCKNTDCKKVFIIKINFKFELFKTKKKYFKMSFKISCIQRDKVVLFIHDLQQTSLRKIKSQIFYKYNSVHRYRCRPLDSAGITNLRESALINN